jgi:hypothetical protein
MDRELLIEIGVEELPAAWMPGLTRQLGERLEARLREARIAPSAPVESRLVLLARLFTNELHAEGVLAQLLQPADVQDGRHDVGHVVACRRLL